jgi:hypothetical protein
MEHCPWVQDFPGAITVCDAEGVILEMNARAVEAFREQGGAGLVGTDLLDCHPEPSRTKLLEMLRSQQANVYTIEKRGIRKLIYQSPWYADGKFAGLVELSLVVPAEMPHFVRE